MEGRGYTDLKLLMIDLMGPDAENYGFEERGSSSPGGSTQQTPAPQPTHHTAQELMDNFDFSPEEVRMYEDGLSVEAILEQRNYG